MAIDSGGNVSDLVAARNCCIARIDCFPEKLRLCRNEQVCQGGKNVYSALSGPTDWILRYIKTTFTINWLLKPISSFSYVLLWNLPLRGGAGRNSMEFFSMNFELLTFPYM